MTEYLQQLFMTFKFNEVLALGFAIAIVLLSLVVIALVANFIAKVYIVSGVRALLGRRKHSKFAKALLEHNVLTRLSHLVPAFFIYMAIPLVMVEGYPFTVALADGIRIFANVYVIVAVSLVITALLSSGEAAYSTLAIATLRPIKSYVQVTKLVIFLLSLILTIAVVLDKSPTALLTGLGALTAVLMLVFRDSILGFVASLQMAFYDMVRIGDWIEVPDFGADGDVMDISLNTVKVQNFDKTIVTIPAYAMLSSGVKNWRGMNESGGRRIKRSINIDIHSIKFCDETLLNRLRKVELLKDYIDCREKEIAEYNAQQRVDKSMLVNGRHMTNIGVFRAYLDAYLRNHPDVHKELTFLIRQLQPTENGIPIELYIFTNDTRWTRYEAIQADIFDHILASMEVFELKVFQNISEVSIHTQ